MAIISPMIKPGSHDLFYSNIAEFINAGKYTLFIFLLNRGFNSLFHLLL